jgi:hypothetical protein
MLPELSTPNHSEGTEVFSDNGSTQRRLGNARRSSELDLRDDAQVLVRPPEETAPAFAREGLMPR